MISKAVVVKRRRPQYMLGNNTVYAHEMEACPMREVLFIVTVGSYLGFDTLSPVDLLALCLVRTLVKVDCGL